MNMNEDGRRSAKRRVPAEGEPGASVEVDIQLVAPKLDFESSWILIESPLLVSALIG